MTDREFFAGHRVMAVLRNHSVDDTVSLAHRAFDLGIGLVEVPIQTPDAVPALEAALAAARERGEICGAGTVTTTDQVDLCARLGVAFTVAPGLSADVVRRSVEVGVPHLPGVATASEIQTAIMLGATWVKAFPATSLGTHWFAAMSQGPFPEIGFVASGGISATNAAPFLSAGASCVAIGAALSDPDQLERITALSKGEGVGG